MAELEIHHESGPEPDRIGQRVGVLAAALAVLLAIVTIDSHRSHTAAIIHKSTANDEWAHYQATRVKYHNLELGQDLAALLQAKGPTADYSAQMKKYDAQGKDIQLKAQQLEEMTVRDEDRALRYDIGEGLLEIGLVLTSLYFISRKKMFPLMGAISGGLGVVVAATGLLLR